MKRNIRFIICLLFISLLAGCRFFNDPIRIGVDNQENAQFFKIAKNLGYLDDSFEIVEYKNRGDNVESFYMNRVDIVYSSVFDSIYFNQRGEDGKIFLMTSNSKKIRALLVNNIMKDLKGKTIAMEADTDEYIEFTKYIETLGLKKKDVDIVFATKKKASELFINEEIDGMYYYKPFYNSTLQVGKIVEGSESLESLEEVLVVNKKILQKRKRELKKIVEAWYSILSIKVMQPEKHIKFLGNIGHEINEEYQQNYYLRADNKRLLVGKEIEKLLNEEAEELNIEIKAAELYTDEIIK